MRLSDGRVPDGVWYTFMDDIRKQPTVKAIPIEWIEKWKRGKTSIEQVVADKIMMDYKHRDWEKENEIN